MFNSAAIIREGASADVTIHVNLYSGIVRIFNGPRRKKYKCNDLINLIRGSECTIQVESKKALSSGPIILRFPARELACDFQQYVEYIQDCGEVLRNAFDIIDRHGTGVITEDSLYIALSSQDIIFNEQDISDMLRLSAQKRFDFSDFFHVLLGTPVYSLFSCLSEWMRKAKKSMEIVSPGEEGASDDKTFEAEMHQSMEAMSSLSAETKSEKNPVKEDTSASVVANDDYGDRLSVTQRH